MRGLGSRVLHGLDLFHASRERAVEVGHYEIYDGEGALLHGYDLAPITRRFGPLLGVSRPPAARLAGLLAELEEE